MRRHFASSITKRTSSGGRRPLEASRTSIPQPGVKAGPRCEIRIIRPPADGSSIYAWGEDQISSRGFEDIGIRVRGRAAPAAVEVRSRLESRTGRFLVHFDIDVIDFVDFPAADVLQPNQGLTFSEAFAALQIFCASPKFGGLIVTEFNPDHDDKDGTLAKKLIEGLAQALQS